MTDRPRADDDAIVIVPDESRRHVLARNESRHKVRRGEDPRHEDLRHEDLPHEDPWHEDPWDDPRAARDFVADGMIPDLRRWSRQILVGLVVGTVLFIGWAAWRTAGLVGGGDDVATVTGGAAQVDVVNVVFPEGFTVAQVAQRLARDVPNMDAQRVLAALADGTLPAPWRPEGVSSYEGLLFPALYEVAAYEDERAVVDRMINEMRNRTLRLDIEAGAARLGVTPYEIIIIASLIEREVKIADERAIVSRVIHNRLAADIELQIDAALYYDAAPGVSFADLRNSDSPYNVYRRRGLPPTPIANPGVAALEAALNPAPDPGVDDEICTSRTAAQRRSEPCQYLFYVLSDTEGRHAFSATFEQHEVRVAEARAAGVLP